MNKGFKKIFSIILVVMIAIGNLNIGLFHSVLSVHASKTNWTFIDGNGTYGINIDTSKGATSPAMTTFGDSLYVAWGERNNAFVSQIRIKKYNGTAWSSADSGGTDGINFNTGKSAGSPSLGVCNGKLYAAWSELNTAGSPISQIRVKEYDGTTWTSVDGSDATAGLNYAAEKDAYLPKIISLNNELYCTWMETGNSFYTNVRVKKYNGGNSWTFIDGGGASGINYDPATAQLGGPTLGIHNNKLYCAWHEGNDPSDGGNYQIRVKEYNGGNSWTSLDGGGQMGLNYGIDDHHESDVQVIDYNGDLYAIWNQGGSPYQIRGKKFVSGSTWTSIDGGLVDTGINKDNTMDGYFPRITVANGKLYCTWLERDVNTFSIFRVRVKEFNGTSWTFVDGNDGVGINFDTSKSSPTGQTPNTCIATYNDKVYVAWPETSTANWPYPPEQLRVAGYQVGAVETETPTSESTNTPTSESTSTPAAESTNTPTPDNTSTPTPIPTSTNTPTPDNTNTPTPTHTPLPAPANTPVPVNTATPIPTNTPTPTHTPTNTPTQTPTNTPTKKPTNTSTPTSTNTPTSIPMEWTSSYPKAGKIAYNTAEIIVSSKYDAKVYCSVLPMNAAAPSSSQVRSSASMSSTLLSNTEKTLSVSNLKPETPYTVYLVLEDKKGILQSSPVSLQIETNSDDSAPNFIEGYPKVDLSISDTLSVKVKIDKYGKLNYAIFPTDKAKVLDDSFFKSQKEAGSGDVKAVSLYGDSETMIKFTGLTSNTSYDIFFITESKENVMAKAVKKMTLKTKVKPSEIVWAKGYPKLSNINFDSHYEPVKNTGTSKLVMDAYYVDYYVKFDSKVLGSVYALFVDSSLGEINANNFKTGLMPNGQKIDPKMLVKISANYVTQTIVSSPKLKASIIYDAYIIAAVEDPKTKELAYQEKPIVFSNATYAKKEAPKLENLEIYNKSGKKIDCMTFNSNTLIYDTSLLTNWKFDNEIRILANTGSNKAKLEWSINGGDYQPMVNNTLTKVVQLLNGANKIKVRAVDEKDASLNSEYILDIKIKSSNEKLTNITAAGLIKEEDKTGTSLKFDFNGDLKKYELDPVSSNIAAIGFSITKEDKTSICYYTVNDAPKIIINSTTNYVSIPILNGLNKISIISDSEDESKNVTYDFVITKKQSEKVSLKSLKYSNEYVAPYGEKFPKDVELISKDMSKDSTELVIPDLKGPELVLSLPYDKNLKFKFGGNPSMTVSAVNELNYKLKLPNGDNSFYLTVTDTVGESKTYTLKTKVLSGNNKIKSADFMNVRNGKLIDIRNKLYRGENVELSVTPEDSKAKVFVETRESNSFSIIQNETEVKAGEKITLSFPADKECLVKVRVVAENGVDEKYSYSILRNEVAPAQLTNLSFALQNPRSTYDYRPLKMVPEFKPDVLKYTVSFTPDATFTIPVIMGTITGNKYDVVSVMKQSDYFFNTQIQNGASQSSVSFKMNDWEYYVYIKSTGESDSRVYQVKFSMTGLSSELEKLTLKYGAKTAELLSSTVKPSDEIGKNSILLNFKNSKNLVLPNVPADVEKITLKPSGFNQATEILFNSKAYKSGETIEVPIRQGINEIVLTAALVNASCVYTLKVKRLFDKVDFSSLSLWGMTKTRTKFTKTLYSQGQKTTKLEDGSIGLDKVEVSSDTASIGINGFVSEYTGSYDVMINGKLIGTGSKGIDPIVNLNPGDNLITFIGYNEEKTVKSDKYVCNIFRKSDASKDSSIRFLSVYPYGLSGTDFFDIKEDKSLNVTIPNTSEGVNLIIKANDPAASSIRIEVSDPSGKIVQSDMLNGSSVEQYIIKSIKEGKNNIKIQVIAEDGIATTTANLTVLRESKLSYTKGYPKITETTVDGAKIKIVAPMYAKAMVFVAKKDWQPSPVGYLVQGRSIYTPEQKAKDAFLGGTLNIYPNNEAGEIVLKGLESNTEYKIYVVLTAVMDNQFTEYLKGQIPYAAEVKMEFCTKLAPPVVNGASTASTSVNGTCSPESIVWITVGNYIGTQSNTSWQGNFNAQVGSLKLKKGDKLLVHAKSTLSGEEATVVETSVIYVEPPKNLKYDAKRHILTGEGLAGYNLEIDLYYDYKTSNQVDSNGKIYVENLFPGVSPANEKYLDFMRRGIIKVRIVNKNRVGSEWVEVKF